MQAHFPHCMTWSEIHEISKMDCFSEHGNNLQFCPLITFGKQGGARGVQNTEWCHLCLFLLGRAGESQFTLSPFFPCFHFSPSSMEFTANCLSPATG
jgi:hypothetical protein